MDLYINNKYLTTVNAEDITDYIETRLSFQVADYYLLQNGRRISIKDIKGNLNVHIIPRLFGGKGGFGSMLRAIGAQIEKTTNREACRDLSGRRLRDINEEKRLKSWIDSQNTREQEAADRKQKKLERLCRKPRHEFKDETYDKERSALPERLEDAVSQGLAAASGESVKRKSEAERKVVKKKKKALWVDDGISSCSDSEDEDGSEKGPSSKSKSEDEDGSEKGPPSESKSEDEDRGNRGPLSESKSDDEDRGNRGPLSESKSDDEDRGNWEPLSESKSEDKNGGKKGPPSEGTSEVESTSNMDKHDTKNESVGESGSSVEKQEGGDKKGPSSDTGVESRSEDESSSIDSGGDSNLSSSAVKREEKSEVKEDQTKEKLVMKNVST